MNSLETVSGLRRRIQRDEIDRVFSRDQIDRVHLAVPEGGRLKTVRTALGMTAGQLGRRVGVSQNAISEAEAAETTGGITLRTIRKIADGLNCDLVYALVPRDSMAAMVRNQANLAARRMVIEVSHGMSLEEQSTGAATLESEIDAVRERLIAQDSRQIWD
ncbi:MAG TPA: mobile mystery protein A [Candidatus Dormibacteraeota bacterium]|nr:mobile mystery protein A [Candidatus Dormibacteraeota bacterium]